MYKHTDTISRLIEGLSKLPGLGQRSAERITFYLLKAPAEETAKLAQAILDIKTKIKACSTCNNITELDPCAICRDPRRTADELCVVEQPPDILSIEKTHEFRGRYHVLLGAISPLDGIGPDDLKIKGLLERVKNEKVKEVIIATNPTSEGETTAVYLARLLKPLGPKITRLARGIPMGSSLEYIDASTMTKALEGRREV